MLEIVIAAIISFIGTNIDDIFINTLFFAQADTQHKIRSVIIGKYFGMGTLVLLSLLGAYGLQFVPQQYIGLLGLIPIVLGVRELIKAQRAKRVSAKEKLENQSEPSRGMALNVALVTMANGADNIGVYIPLFASYSVVQMLAVVAIFALMIALWCVLGKKLADMPFLRSFLLKYKHIIVPAVFIFLGIYIFARSGLLG